MAEPRRLDPPSDPLAVSGARVLPSAPAIGGRLKDRAEDFFVEEIPLFEPSGSGPHVFVCLEKINLSTSETLDLLARHFGVARGDIGYAGMKDKRAVTRQTFSVHLPLGDPERARAIRDDRIRVMWVDRHEEKLRRGQLAGNRFAIRVRGVDASAAPRALKALRELERRGAPNRFGPQRFGARGNNHEVGRRLLAGDVAGAIEHVLLPYEGAPELADHEARLRCAAGDWKGASRAFPRASRAERRLCEALAEGASPEEAIDWVDETQRRFWASAAQSAAFNLVLDERVRDQTFDELLEGDLALRHARERSGREPIAVDAEVLADPGLRERVARVDLSPSGPMWGPEMARAGGAVGERERAALASLGLAPEDLDRYDALHGGDLIRGARRELRVPVSEATVEGGVDEQGPYVLCAFALPSGAFATVVMDEIMSAPGNDAARAGEREARA